MKRGNVACQEIRKNPWKSKTVRFSYSVDIKLPKICEKEEIKRKEEIVMSIKKFLLLCFVAIVTLRGFINFSGIIGM